jgi:hypothetical protein
LLSNAGYPTGEDGRLAVATLVAAYISDENEHRSVDVENMNEFSGRVFPWA